MVNVEYIEDPYGPSIIWGADADRLTQHRETGPSEIYDDGAVLFSDIKHYGRKAGPSIIYADGTIQFTHPKTGVLHNDKGPAVILPDGTREYHVNGKEIDPVLALVLFKSV